MRLRRAGQRGRRRPRPASNGCSNLGPLTRLTFDTLEPKGAPTPARRDLPPRRRRSRSLRRGARGLAAARRAARQRQDPPRRRHRQPRLDAANPRIFMVVAGPARPPARGYNPTTATRVRRAVRAGPQRAAAHPRRLGPRRHALGAGEAVPGAQPPLQRRAADRHHDQPAPRGARRAPPDPHPGRDPAATASYEWEARRRYERLGGISRERLAQMTVSRLRPRGMASGAPV